MSAIKQRNTLMKGSSGSEAAVTRCGIDGLAAAFRWTAAENIQ
jgi:hypothetical protein